MPSNIFVDVALTKELGERYPVYRYQLQGRLGLFEEIVEYRGYKFQWIRGNNYDTVKNYLQNVTAIKSWAEEVDRQADATDNA